MYALPRGAPTPKCGHPAGHWVSRMPRKKETDGISCNTHRESAHVWVGRVGGWRVRGSPPSAHSCECVGVLAASTTPPPAQRHIHHSSRRCKPPSRRSKARHKHWRRDGFGPAGTPGDSRARLSVHVKATPACRGGCPQTQRASTSGATPYAPLRPRHATGECLRNGHTHAAARTHVV